MNCEFCQSPVHIWFQCPKKPDGWKPERLAMKSVSSRAAEPSVEHRASTAARKAGPALDRQVSAKSEKAYSTGDSPAGERPGRRGDSKQRVAKIPAGTQALPVDTNSPADLQPASADNSGSDGLGVMPPLRDKFDKKAWMRDYMREYMRKRRAAQ